MAMKKVAKQTQDKPKRSGDSSDVYQNQMQDVRSLAAAKASKFSNSPSASTRSRSALQRPNSLARPGRNMSSSAQGGMYPPASKKASVKKESSASGSDRGAKMKADAVQKKKQDEAKKAKAFTDSKRFKKLEGPKYTTREQIKKNPYYGFRTMAFEKNATSKNTTVGKGIAAVLKSNNNDIYRDRNEKLMIRGKYKGKGSK